MKTILPKPLKEGGTVAIVAPSWFPDAEKLYRGELSLNGMGFEVDVQAQCSSQWGQFAGAPEERVTAIHECFMDDNIDAIMAARGGYGALQLLDKLDYDLISKHHKPFVGFSDSTALLNAIYAKTGKVTYHGPMADSTFGHRTDEIDVRGFLDAVVHQKPELTLDGGKSLHFGSAKGVLLGGNMSVFDQLIGTEYMPNADDIILLLEDVGEKINELDKKLIHLKHCGFLANVRGVILGGMETLEDNDEPYGFSIAETIANYLPDAPVVTAVHAGHGDHLITLPIGAEVKLHANDLYPKIRVITDTPIF
jgi:muramoyltetrapeptide carboxypeptidase